MSVVMRFQQLLAFADAWREDEQPDTTFALLATIGYLKRAGLEGKNLQKLRSIEVELLNKIEAVIESLYYFIEGTTLTERARRLSEEDTLIDFYQDRDDAELAWQIATEYADEYCPHNGELLGKMRDILDAVDDEILFSSNTVKTLREIGALESLSYYDQDFFWWLPGKREGCYLPIHRKEHYLASYADGLLPLELNIKFAKHLLSCPLCREDWDLLKKTISEELIEELSRPIELAVAEKKNIPTRRSFLWSDDEDVWKVRLSLYGPHKEQSFTIEPNGKNIRGKMKLLAKDVSMEINAGNARCAQVELKNAIEKCPDLTLHFTDAADVKLHYRGEDNE